MNDLPKGNKILIDGDLRIVKKTNRKWVAGAMTPEGMKQMIKLELDGYFKGFDIHRLVDGHPFMAIER